MYLDEFFDYKNQLMSDIVNTQEIVNLLTDDTSKRATPTLLIYSQLFPFEYIPDTVEHGHTFICFDVDIQRVYSHMAVQGMLYIWEFTHKDKLRLPQGGVRTDALASAIDKRINGSWMYGMGTLELYSVKRFSPINDWQGKVLAYQTKENNRVSPSDKTRPANRKTSNAT